MTLEVEMQSNRYHTIRVRWDHHELEKQKVFFELNEVAWSRNIAVIYAWVRMRDLLVGVWDDILFQSNGPSGKSNTCVFCGRDGLNNENAYELGKFLADGECFRDYLIDAQGTTFLAANAHRPGVIVVTSDLPGSIENLILKLAWGIGMHFWLSQRPSASFDWRHKAAESYARKLISRIAERRPVKAV